MSPTKRKSVDNRIPELCHEISKKFAILADLMDETDMPETLASTITGLAEDIGATNSKRRRVPKDPLAPHRNLTSYIHFTNEVRPGIVKDEPTIAPRDVARLLGVKWRALTEKQRDKYDKIAKEDFLRYKQEMAAYKNGTKTDTPSIIKAEPTDSKSSPSNGSDEEDELSSANGEVKGQANVGRKTADFEDEDSESSEPDSSESDSSDTTETSDSSDDD